MALPAVSVRQVLWSGLGAWLLQRATALLLLAFLLYLVLHLLLAPPPTYAAWRQWLLAPPMRAALLLAGLALALHAWVGVRDVILDYVKPLPLRLAAFALLGLGLAGTLAWMALALLPGPVAG